MQKDMQKTAAPKPAPEPTAPAEEEAAIASFAEIIALPEAPERPTDSITVTAKGKRWRFVIYTDGMDDAPRWSSLTTALMSGSVEQQIALGQKKPFGIKIILPDGTPLFVDDPGYLGSVKVLQMVLKEPVLSFEACLIVGHKLGKAFVDVCEWAAVKNGVNEYAVSAMQALLKNGETPDPPASS